MAAMVSAILVLDAVLSGVEGCETTAQHTSDLKLKP